MVSPTSDIEPANAHSVDKIADFRAWGGTDARARSARNHDRFDSPPARSTTGSLNDRETPRLSLAQTRYKVFGNRNIRRIIASNARSLSNHRAVTASRAFLPTT